MLIKTSDHIRRRGNVRGRGSLRPGTGFWVPLFDRASMDLADQKLARRQLARLVKLGRAPGPTTETRLNNRAVSSP